MHFDRASILLTRPAPKRVVDPIQPEIIVHREIASKDSRFRGRVRLAIEPYSNDSIRKCPREKQRRRRRSRRFAVGDEMPDGPLAYRSRHEPIPLTELERMLVLSAMGGTTGWHYSITRHARYAPHVSNYAGGAAGRTFPSAAGFHTAELFFNDVRVPQDNLIGEVDRGFIHMMEWLPQERLGAAASNIAHAAQILEETIEYAKERKAFGQPVGSFQYNKFLLAELVTQIEVSQAYVDQAVMSHVRGELTSVDAAKAKWWSAQVQNDVIDACVQLHGGYGYMNEYRVARAWRDARVTKIWAGSNEIMKELIGRDLGL